LAQVRSFLSLLHFRFLIAAMCSILGLLPLFLQLLLPHAENASTRPSIWFVSWQHTGHIKGMCPIAIELQARGFPVRLAVHEEVAHLVPPELRPPASAGRLPWSWAEELRFRQKLWDPLPPEVARVSDSEDGSKEDGQQEADTQRANESEAYFLGSQKSLAEGLRKTIESLPNDDRPQLLVVDVASVGAMDLAERMQLPYAVVSGWPVGPTLHSIGDASALMHSWMPSELFIFTQSRDQQGLMDRIKRAVYTTALPWVFHWAGMHVPRRELRRGLGLGDGGSLELLELPRWSGGGERPPVVVLSHWGLDRPRPLPPQIRLVGPVEDYDARARQRPALDEEVRKWLEESKVGGLVYVSFGTNVRLRPTTILHVIEAMASLETALASRDRRIRFLWDVEWAVVATALGYHDGMSDADESLVAPPSLPANVLFAPKVDQLAVLASGLVSAFVSHCGLNSVHEAAHFGVPIIGLPFLGDQFVTVYLLEEAGAGIRMSVPKLSAPALADAVREVLFSPAYSEAARRVGDIARLAGGSRAAADFLESVVAHGAQHLQTIQDQMPAAGRLWDVRVMLLALLFGMIVSARYGIKALIAFNADPCETQGETAQAKTAKEKAGKAM